MWKFVDANKAVTPGAARVLVVYLLLCLGYSLAQSLPLSQGPPPHELLFPEVGQTEPFLAATLGLSGPVESVTLQRFRVDVGPGESRKRIPIAYRPVSVVVASMQLHFDKQGRLVQRDDIDFEGQVFAMFKYSYEADFYSGFAGYEVSPSGELFPLKFSLDRSLVESGNVLTRFRDAGYFNSQDILYRYDEAGRLAKEEYFDLKGELTSTTSYHYEGDLLVEKLIPTYQRWVYSYTPEGLLMQEVLYSLAGTSQPESNGELSEVAKPYLQAWVDFRYDPKGDLLEKRYHNIKKFNGAVPEHYLSRVESFENGRLTEVLYMSSDGDSQIETYSYAGDAILSYVKRSYDSGGSAVNEYRCDYLNFDQYNNWTELRCTPVVKQGELNAVLDPFSGDVWTRSITYYEEQ